MDHSIAAGKFKAECLHLLDEVAHQREGIVITKHGRPVAKLVPMPAERSLHGALAGSAHYSGDISAPTGEVWDVEA